MDRYEEIEKAAWEKATSIDMVDAFKRGVKWAEQNPSDVLIDEIRKLYDDWCDEYYSWKGVHITHKDEEIPPYYEYIKEHLNGKQ